MFCGPHERRHLDAMQQPVWLRRMNQKLLPAADRAAKGLTVIVAGRPHPPKAFTPIGDRDLFRKLTDRMDALRALLRGEKACVGRWMTPKIEQVPGGVGAAR